MKGRCGITVNRINGYTETVVGNSSIKIEFRKILAKFAG